MAAGDQAGGLETELADRERLLGDPGHVGDDSGDLGRCLERDEGSAGDVDRPGDMLASWPT